MTTRFAKTAAFAAAAALMTIVAAGCGNGADGARDVERADAVWSQHVDHTGTPLTMRNSKRPPGARRTVIWSCSTIRPEAWPHMAIPTVAQRDDHRSTLIPATVTDQSELLQFRIPAVCRREVLTAPILCRLHIFPTILRTWLPASGTQARMETCPCLP